MASTTMYQCPRYSDHNAEITLPNCMYKMKNIQNTQGGAVEEKITKDSESPEIRQLFERQVKILEDLEALSKQIDSLQKAAGIKDQEIKKNVNEITKGTDQSLQSISEDDLDIIITGTPSNPPISALILFNYLHQQGIKLSSACHKHSNLKEAVPFDLMKIIGWQESIIEPHQKLNLTFIWKEDPFGPSITVNPRVQTPIKGDSNIARFLCRKFAPQLYESLGENETLIADFLIDLATTKIISGSIGEAKKVFAQVEHQLGKNTWLINDKFTIADVVVFSAIRVKKIDGLLPHNLKQWYKLIEAKFC